MRLSRLFVIGLCALLLMYSHSAISRCDASTLIHEGNKVLRPLDVLHMYGSCLSRVSGTYKLLSSAGKIVGTVCIIVKKAPCFFDVINEVLILIRELVERHFYYDFYNDIQNNDGIYSI